MYKQILAKLEAKYPGLSKVFLGLIATQMATKVTEESGIDAAVAELDNAPISVQTLAAEFQKEGDRRVTAAKQEFLKNPPKPDKADPPADESTKPAPGDEPPSWFKKYAEESEKKFAEINRKNAVGSMQSRLKEKLKDVPEKFYSRIPLPEKEEDFEAFVTDIQTDWNGLKDDQVVIGMANSIRPANGTGAAQGAKAVSPEIKAFVDKQKAAEAKTVVK